MSTGPLVYSIQRDAVHRYFFWGQFLAIALVGLFIMGFGALAAVVYAFTLGLWLPGKQADALRYWLDGTTLRVEEGVFFLKRKAIPLDRITDIV